MSSKRDEFDCVERIFNLPSDVDANEHAQSILQDTLATYGFDFFCFAIYGAPRGAIAIDNYHLLLNAYPNAWADRYYEKHYWYSDPVLAHCGRSPTPIDWTTVQNQPDQPASAEQVMREAHEHDLCSGVTVTVRDVSGRLGILSLATRDVYSAELRDRIRHAIPIAQFVLSHLVEKLEAHFHVRLEDLQRYKLSERERECLRWVAAGKTSWEIGHILGIAERTAIFHLNNAMKKLGAVNRSHAVARALQHGVIAL